MDKQEYKMRSQEIKTFIIEGKYGQAIAVADTIDWARVKNVSMLCTISDLYKVNRNYEKSRDVLLEAYERNPDNRKIVYSLCELCIKLGQIVEAIEFYKAYMYLAPTDTSKYLLQYKLYVAQEVSLEEQIAVLEEFKRRDYREKWGYELAFLYHRLGLQTRCIEACDELIVWFGDGRYVKKAMDLKMLHAPLTKGQQILYEKNHPSVNQAHVIEKDAPEVRRFEEQVGQEIKENLVTESADKVNVAYLEEVISKNVAEFYTEMAPVDTLQENIIATVEKPVFEDIEKSEAVMEEPVVESMKSQIKLEENRQTEETPDVPEIGILEDLINQETKIIELREKKDSTTNTIEIPELVIEEIEKAVTGESSVESSFVVEESEVPVLNIDLPEELQSVLAKGYDGPIHLVVPAGQDLRNQIVGEISLEEIIEEQQKMEETIIHNVEELQQVEMPEEVEELIKEGREAEEIAPIQLPAEDSIQIMFEDDEDDFDEEFLDDEDFLDEDSEEEDQQEDLSEEILEEYESTKITELSDRQKTLFAPFIHTRKEVENLIHALNHISLQPNKGNLLIVGPNDYGTKDLAKCMIKEVQATNEDFIGKMAKIEGSALNGKNFETILNRLHKGSLIIENAGEMNGNTIENLLEVLKSQEVMIIMECTKKSATRFYRNYPTLKEVFDATIEIEELDDNALVIAGKKYAQKLEYSIDELGLLALHTRIADMQTIDHKVTIEEVRQIVVEAIVHANRKNVGHFMELITGSRYDKEDMIVLREKDFII